MQPWLLGTFVPCTVWSHHLSCAPWLQVSQRELLSVWRQRARQKALSFGALLSKDIMATALCSGTAAIGWSRTIPFPPHELKY